MTDAAIEQGLSSARPRPSGCASSARRRRTPRARSPASSPATSSRSSTRSSASSSCSTSALGLFADSIFGLIAVINSYIGIRQELKAKRTLDELAVLVAPHAKVVRDGAAVEPARRGGRARRRGRGRAGRPAGRRRRGDPQPRHDPRRVDADRRGRRGPQGPRRPGALGLLLHLRLRPLHRRRGARGELRRAAGRRGEGLPPPALAAAGRGQPGDRRLRLRDGAAGGRC